jgi:hypothetical protein
MIANDCAQLAILIGALHWDGIAMHHDLAAMYQTLRIYGLASTEVPCLEGRQSRPMLLRFRRETHHNQ